MAVEAFLINPARRKKRGKTRRANPLPGGLLSRMMKKYGRKRGMKKAWEEYRGKKGGTKRNMARPRTKVPGWITSRHPKLKSLLSKRSKTSRGRLRGLGFSLSDSKSWEKWRKRKSLKNPFGEEVIVVGANPKRRKRRGKKRGGLALFNNPRRSRRSGALRAWRKRRSLSTNPRRRRAVRLYDNPRGRRVARYRDNRSRVRRFRRNPALAASMGGISLSKPMSLLIPIAVGLASRMATQRIPSMIGIVSPLPRYGVQVAVAVGGGLLLNKFLGRTNAMVWTIVSGVTILEDVLNTYVFRTAAVAGMGYYQPEEVSGAGAFPEQGMGAYPYGSEVIY